MKSAALRTIMLALLGWGWGVHAQQLGTPAATELNDFLAGLPAPATPVVATPAAGGEARWLTVEREWVRANDPGESPAPQAMQGASTGTAAASGSAMVGTADPRLRRALPAGNRGRRATGDGGSRTTVGSTTITVSVRNITTTAARGNAATDIGVRQSGQARTDIAVDARNVVTQSAAGDATTKIGVRDGGGGRTVVSARDTITRSVNGSATTEIGGDAGVVSTGMTYNEGGTLAIGSGGISRNGMRCLEIFRQTCIVHIYFRRKSDPCAPGYWMDFRRCLLPSDRKHRIVR